MLATASTLFKEGKNEHRVGDSRRHRRCVPCRQPGLSSVGSGPDWCGRAVRADSHRSAAYAMAEAMGWRHGLDERPRRAKLFYGIISLSTLAGMLINFVGINPMTALFWTAVINGFLARPSSLS